MKKIITAILSITAILNAALYAVVSGPYTVDAYTLHLYHFDGNANDAVATNPINLTLAYGATVTTTSYTGFGTMLNTYEGTSGTGNMPIAYVNEKAVNNFFGTDGAFTFEAIVKPAVAIGAIPNNMQIISGDDDSGQTRGWLFRVTTTGRLEFTKLTGTQETFSAALPTTGEQAWGLEGFHVAVTYNGLENTPNNLKFYWTRLNSSVSQAVLLMSFQMVTDLSISPAVDFAVGNGGFPGDRNTLPENRRPSAVVDAEILSG